VNVIRGDNSNVLHRLLDHEYPNIERGEGVWLFSSDGTEILDACSGGAMVATLGHGDPGIAAAAAAQAEKLPYTYNHHFTNDAQEAYAERLIRTSAPEMARVRFVSGGSEANETAIRLVRGYHVERGDTKRWRIITQAQSYHGALAGALGLTGRRNLHDPYGEYLPAFLHIPPPGGSEDPDGERALAELDQILDQVGDEVAAFFCEAVGGAAMPAHRAPDSFWQGLRERRDEHGFLVCFDEVLTGMGRTGAWFASATLPIEADVLTAGKAMGAGYAPLAATLCRDHVYDAFAEGGQEFDHGHTWDGAPLPCAVGAAVLEQYTERDLVADVAARGPRLLSWLEEALAGSSVVGDIRGEGFLLGVEFVDPRDGSFLPDDLQAASRCDLLALERGLLITSTHSQADRMAGDQTVLAPAYVATDEELQEMVARFAATVDILERDIKEALAPGRGTPETG
jgi:adenosylmethionine-8-amino-7-oxononanoate aminotransferase